MIIKSIGIRGPLVLSRNTKCNWAFPSPTLYAIPNNSEDWIFFYTVAKIVCLKIDSLRIHTRTI